VRAAAHIRWTAAIPTALLVLVALTQIALTRTTALTPWKGGGFGMFSTTDDVSRRTVRVFVSAPDRSEEIAIPPSLADLAARAAAQPGDWLLGRLARAVAARERRHGRRVDEVVVQCWRVVYEPVTLRAHTHLAGALRYQAAAGVVAR
jgi:hypothetical protein